MDERRTDRNRRRPEERRREQRSTAPRDTDRRRYEQPRTERRRTDAGRTRPAGTGGGQPKRSPRDRRAQELRRKKAAARRRRRRIARIILLIVVLVVLFFAFRLFAAVREWESKAEDGAFLETDTNEKDSDVINVAVFGTDEDGYRADVNLVVSFNTNTKKLSMLSVPRDTRVVMTEEMTEYLEEKGRPVPEQDGVYGQCKLTEVHAYAGRGSRCSFSKAMLEDVLDIDIDYYVKVDLSAFRRIVDAVGGVDMMVEDRLYYSDPVQDLYIDLYPGMQHLDGAKAEQLVRFRSGYAMGDIKRIQVQQKFIQTLIEKVCSTEGILDNLNEFVDVVMDCTESDITLKEALKYVKYIKEIEPEKVTSDTLPGEGGKVYYELDQKAVEELVDWRIFGIQPERDTEEAEKTDALEAEE